MGYCIPLNVDQMLAQALTSARPDGSGARIKLVNINNVRDLNRIPDDIVNYYISLGDNQIDGALSQMYFTPLKKCANGQWVLDTDISEYNQIIELSTPDAETLVPGDEVLIHDDSTGEGEYHVVNEVLDRYRFATVDTIEQYFQAGDVRVIRVQYPPPISQISARLAASFIYDKYFSAQASPDVSDYGKELRNYAMDQLNDTLTGRNVLKCQRRKGDIFGNPWIDSRYGLREHPQRWATNDQQLSRSK
jgi:hypothetical protein